MVKNDSDRVCLYQTPIPTPDISMSFLLLVYHGCDRIDAGENTVVGLLRRVEPLFLSNPFSCDEADEAENENPTWGKVLQTFRRCKRIQTDGKRIQRDGKRIQSVGKPAERFLGEYVFGGGC